jgi:hypothetical protein
MIGPGINEIHALLDQAKSARAGMEVEIAARGVRAVT